MLNLLPKATKLVLRDSTEKPTAAQLKLADHVFIIQPRQRRKRLLEKPPMDAVINHLRKATGNRLVAATTAGSSTAPGVTCTEYDDALSVFAQLTLARKLFAALKPLNPKRIAVICNDQSEQTRRAFCEAIAAAGHAYSCSLTTFKKRPLPARRLRALDLYLCPALDKARLKAEANGNNVARVLSALPPNVLNARNYVEAVRDLAHAREFDVHVYDQPQLEQMGANAFLAVARGNAHGDAGIVRLRRQGTDATPWVSLVGKGVCYDTGGINVKDADRMFGMHEDMQGSSVALGTFLTLAELAPDRTLECWLAITENRIDGEAHTPNEIVTAANGVSIEVVHTDAEGRMALSDTLHFASQQKPQLIIDYATLTGACVNAVTSRYAGTFTNRAALNEPIRAAGQSSGERTWPFPMDDDFDDMIESSYADVLQCPRASGGDHIAAARFLQKFVGTKTPWIHVDLASAMKRGGLAHIDTDTTGFGVRFTTHLLIEQALHDVL